MSSDYSVVLRLRHPAIDPNEITQRIGMMPQYSWRAGEPRRLETGEAGEGVYRESCWVSVLSTPSLLGTLIELTAQRRDPRATGAAMPRATPPQAELYIVLAKMKRQLPFWREFAEQGGSIDCLLQVQGAERFQLELSPALLALCGELKLTLAIEVDADGAQRAVAAA